MSLTPDRVEVIISGILEEVPEKLSLSDTRNLVVELLFGLGLSPKDLPMFMLLVVDAYMGDRVIDQMKKG
tara:strand:- start:914 stop:1123 length:210 start_codon:yes stop_codon:yes gene_type:complete